jgi:hypothetical protein
MNLLPPQVNAPVQSLFERGGADLVATLEALKYDLMHFEQAKTQIVHRFAPGIYIRETSIPAGTLVVGHWHKTEHLNVLLKGSGIILLENGTPYKVTAPFTMISKPGRKIAYVLEDAVWQNIHATDERDIDKLEAMLIDVEAEWTGNVAELSQRMLSTSKDENDFELFLQENGLDADWVLEQAQRQDTMKEMPHGGYKFKITDSAIHGKGVIATADIAEGEVIGPARLGEKRTPLGRYINHSATPNAKPVRRGTSWDIDMVATRNIDGMKGFMDGEEITIDYRESFKMAMQINLEG